MSSYNFKDNLTIDNNKYLKWLDITGTSRANIIGLDNYNNIRINSDYGNMYLNSNSVGNKWTFINANHTCGVIIGSRLGIGFASTENMTSDITLVKNGLVGINTTVGSNDGYLALAGSSSLVNNATVQLYGNDHSTNAGHVSLKAGNVVGGNINMYTGNDILRFQILGNGASNFLPDGVTSRLSVTDSTTTVTNDLIITSTTESNNASTGALQIRGGIGILGNLYLDGTISLNSATGNINFDSSQTSTSYTTGAIFLSGGIGISTTVNSSSVTSGGAISIAGGAAIGKDLYVGGKITIVNTDIPTSSQTGSLVLYGGLGINGPIFSRADSSHLLLSPQTNGNPTEIIFYSNNNFSSSPSAGSSWNLGQNVNSVGSGNFGLVNSDLGTIFSANYTGYFDIYTKTHIIDTTNSVDVNDGGAFTVSGGASFKKDVYIGGSIILGEGGTISGGTGSTTYEYLTITATDEAINYSTGALVVDGGVTISCSTDADSITAGGSFLTAGGASIKKSLYVGGPVLKIPIGTTLARPSGEMGYIRYNTTTNQFEGYGLNNWGSLGGVIDIAQTTKILAELSPGENDGNLRFITANTERMRINSSGNIGIGTSSPGYLVDISGNANIRSDLYINHYLGVGVSAPLAPVHIATTFSNTSPSENGIFMGVLSDGSSVIQLNSSVGSNLDFSSSGVDFKGRVSYDNNSESMKFYTDSSERVRFTNTELVSNVNLVASNTSHTIGSIFTTGGNVGILTTSPSGNLDVMGSIYTNTIHIRSTSDSALVSDGGITIACSKDSISITNGGGLTLFGGASIAKTLNVDNTTIHSTTDASGIGSGGSLTIFGGSSISKNLYVGGNVQNGTLTVISTENGIGIGSGGSLTVLGGASISKDVYVGGTVTSSSDIRLKKNISPLKEDDEKFLNSIEKIRTIRYNYKNDDTMTNHIGFIAQDFKHMFPELLRCTDGGFYSLDYQKMSVILLECVKELRSEIRELKKSWM
jgi:hypothetical protein